MLFSVIKSGAFFFFSAPFCHQWAPAGVFQAALLLCITLGLDTPLREAPRALVFLEASDSWVVKLGENVLEFPPN